MEQFFSYLFFGQLLIMAISITYNNDDDGCVHFSPLLPKKKKMTASKSILWDTTCHVLSYKELWCTQTHITSMDLYTHIWMKEFHEGRVQGRSLMGWKGLKWSTNQLKKKEGGWGDPQKQLEVFVPLSLIFRKFSSFALNSFKFCNEQKDDKEYLTLANGKRGYTNILFIFSTVLFLITSVK